MGLGKDYAGQNCMLARSLEVLGERWTLLVIRDAFYGVRRFADFQAHLDAPKAVLSDRLETLVNAGVLVKQRYQDSPPREEYVLTDVGAELWPAMWILTDWGTRNLEGGKPLRLFRHVGCGGTLIGAGVCNACGAAVAPADLQIELAPGATSQRTDRVSRVLREPHRLLEPLFPTA